MLTKRMTAGAMVGLMAAVVAGCDGSNPATGDDALGTTSTSAPQPASTTPAPTPAPSSARSTTPPASRIAGLPAAQILAKTQAAAALGM